MAVSTQSDVARLSGVSRSTVASILSNAPDKCRYKKETRAKVLAAVRALNYRPHFAARSLKNNRTGVIAIAVPNFHIFPYYMQPYYLQGICEGANELGYSVAFCQYQENPESKGRQLEDMILESRCDGVLIFGGQMGERDPREDILAQMQVPSVSIERPIAYGGWADFDHRLGGQLAARHLIACGCRRPAFVGLDPNMWPFQERYVGFRQEVERAGLTLEPDAVRPLVGVGDFVTTGRAAAEMLLDSGWDCDGWFCVVDDIAMAAMQVLAERGVRVPGDVQIVGYDNRPLSLLSAPPLTTIEQDAPELGREVVRLLHQLIQEPEQAPRYSILKPRLIVRQSTR